MYQKMTEINTEFTNWLLLHPNVNRATSKILKEFSDEKFPSTILNQTIRDVKSEKKFQHARTFKKMWCSLYNQNLKVEKNGDFYTVSFLKLGKRVGVLKSSFDRIIEEAAKQGTAKLYKKKCKWFVVLPIPFDVEEAKAKRGGASTSVSGIWQWQVSEPSPCSLKGTDVPPYADAMPPDD
jgi:hypothetical protein